MSVKEQIHIRLSQHQVSCLVILNMEIKNIFYEVSALFTHTMPVLKESPGYTMLLGSSHLRK